MMRFACVVGSVLVAAAVGAASPKYVFLFIGDGMSTPQRMMAEEFALATGHGELTLNHFKNQASLRTCSASSLVTDSAAAATALACGTKTQNGSVGVDKDLNRLESVAEVAHRKGRKVGIVTTVTINHATPAGFCAHRKHRGLLYQIGLDIVNTGFDYFAGGGFAGRQNDKKDPFYKGDLLELAVQNGYVVATNTPQFRALKPGARAFYRGADGELQYAIDADGTEPTLAELTQKGVELLDNPAGFFMMIEGGKLDHAGHANDAATNLREALSLDAAVRVAAEFQKKHAEETLIVVTGDHETGGMAMGFAGTGYALYPRRLAAQKCSYEEFPKKVRAAIEAAMKAGRKPSFTQDLRPLLEIWFGFNFTKADAAASRDAKAGTKFADKNTTADMDTIYLTKADVDALRDAFKRDVDMLRKPPKFPRFKSGTAAIRIMSAHAGVGWTSGSHTALPVLTTSTGVGADAFTGLLDNTEISRRLKAFFE
ncbi:MAG: alkaline phosphatase [Kiritimatiellae bacterium]|nr:alkaline phosphatase [Kiritimatiellia bacterium]